MSKSNKNYQWLNIRSNSAKTLKEKAKQEGLGVDNKVTVEKIKELAG